MLKEGSTRCILKHHHPNKGFILLTVANKIDKVLMIQPWQCINLQKIKNKIHQYTEKREKKRAWDISAQCISCWSWVFQWPQKKETFFRYAISEFFVHSLEVLINVEATAISTPLDSVPLYTMQPSKVSIILLKSSQAVSSSGRFNLGTPVFHICTWISLTSLTQKNTRQHMLLF